MSGPLLFSLTDLFLSDTVLFPFHTPRIGEEGSVVLPTQRGAWSSARRCGEVRGIQPCRLYWREVGPLDTSSFSHAERVLYLWRRSCGTLGGYCEIFRYRPPYTANRSVVQRSTACGDDVWRTLGREPYVGVA